MTGILISTFTQKKREIQETLGSLTPERVSTVEQTH